MSAPVADQFSAIAAEYETHWADVLMPANRELVAMVPLAEARSVLDLGGGNLHDLSRPGSSGGSELTPRR